MLNGSHWNLKREFEIGKFLNEAQTKYYFEKGRTSLISLREYRKKLYVCKQLGLKYSEFLPHEAQKVSTLISELRSFLSSETNIGLANVCYLGVSDGQGRLLQVDEFCGQSLRSTFATLPMSQKMLFINIVLSNLSSLITANGDREYLRYSIEPTPDNYAFIDKELFYVDLMPPFVGDEELIIKMVTEKQQTQILPEVQKFTFFSQKGLYLTFLTKFGAADVLFFNQLFTITLAQIKNHNVKGYVDNNLFRNVTKVTKRGLKFAELFSALRALFGPFSPVDRDLIKLCALIFINDLVKIQTNLSKYNTPFLEEFMCDRKCISEIIDSIVYSKYNLSTYHGELKELVAGLIALQYGL